jgi:hypothetical protein
MQHHPRMAYVEPHGGASLNKGTLKYPLAWLEAFQRSHKSAC